MASSPSSPAFLFVPGYFHTPHFFQFIVANLQEQGHFAEAVSLPTIGDNGWKFGLDDEIQAVQESVAKIVDSRKQDVVLVCHSYGGWPGSRAVKGWDKALREQEGKVNGISQLVFLSAFLIPEGGRGPLDFIAKPEWINYTTVSLHWTRVSSFYVSPCSRYI